jgi:sarcosine oxidase
LHLPLAVERQVLFWFEPLDAAKDEFAPPRFPIFIWENEPHRFFYGFPNVGDGVKIGVHHQGETTTADKVQREVASEEISRAKELLHARIPRAAGKFLSASVCMYTNTPDEHFILDKHPAYPQVVIASPCSGHGFKFSPLIGEITARMLRGERQMFDLGLFKLGRFRP